MKLCKKHVPNTTQYHPENLFKLNGEGLTWEEYKQKEWGITDPKDWSGDPGLHIISPLIFLGLVAVADILCFSIVTPNIKAILSTHPLSIVALISLTSVLSFANYSGVIQLFCMVAGLLETDKYNNEGATQEPNSSTVRNYIKDTGLKIDDFYGEVGFLEVKAQERSKRDDIEGYNFYYQEARKRRLFLDDKRLPRILKKYDLIFVPATTQGETLELMAITSENNTWKWSKTIGFRHGIKGAATYSTTLDTTKLSSIITQDTNRLCDFIAKPEMQQILTARMYAQQQANKVHGIAEITLPDWITSDSVLLDDYKGVKQWYINYRDMLTEKIYDLAQEHAYNLRCETERKTSRSDAISAALSF